MKKYILLFVIITTSFCIAQNTLPQTGNIGIGTIKPVSNLHVYSSDSPSNALTGQLQIGGSYNVVNDIFLSIGTNKIGEYAFINGGKGNIGYIPLAIMGGNVGIGTSAPTAKLDVKGIIKSFEATKLESEVNSNILLNEVSGSAGISNRFYNRLWLLRDNASESSWLTSRLHDGISIDGSFAKPQIDTKTWWERDPYDNIQSWGNGIEAYLTINRGNVGIGTKTPNSRLDLGTGYGTKGAKLLIYNDDATSELSGTKCVFYMDNFASNNLNLVFPEAASYPGLFTISAKNTSNTILNPYFSIAGLTGNVGIGTTSPDSKLTVAGNIHAREVKVTVNAGAVPDYVFANDYKLKSLEDVENYIKQNNHLPEIPSAQEIEKNGLMLAEMNLSLLKKIEELTLHAIEQQKSVSQLIKIVEEQNKRLNSLEKK